MKNIVIVESPAKSKTIEKYLGPDFKVLASYGHVRDLPSKDGSVDPANDFAMNYQVNPDSEKNIKAILAALKTADTLYLATDPDREGEAISWHVWEEVKNRLGAKATKLKVHRIVFTEITKTAVTKAIQNPRDIAMSMVNAQQARRALDYLVGFNLSPVLWRKVRRGLSAGRVQSVALRLICDRENEIDAFKAEEYWTIDGLFNGLKTDFPAKLHTYNGKRVEKFSFTDEKTATGVVSDLAGHSYHIADVEKKQTKRRPSPPFMTSTLQQDAARRLYFSAKKTMMTAQRLYEGGHITYMRTDSVNLASEAINAVRDTIASKYGAEYLPEKPNFYKSKQQNAQEAHEAIRPTNPMAVPGTLKLEPDQAKLYQLIWQRTMACQMAPAKVDQTALVIQPQNSDVHTFRATGSIIVFAGFLKAYGMVAAEDKSDDDKDAMNDKDVILPPFNKGDVLDVRKIKPEQHFTEPPPRYSEASLVKTLEEYGIGRPSTYAAILSTIQDRGYVRLEQRRFHPEDVGRVVTKFLTEHFETYVDYDFTANMENDLDAISRGEKDWKPTLHAFWTPFKTQVDDKIESVKKSDVTSESTGETCPTCNKGELLIRLGRYGKFKGCNNYPECKHTEPLEGREQKEQAAPVDTGVVCPTCGEGSMVERKSRRGKIFYSCSTYPTCTYATWDKPTDTPCPKCAWPLITEKETKRYGHLKKCPQDDCDWQDPPMKASAAKKPAAAKKAAGKKTTTKATTKKAPAKKPAAKKKTAVKK